MKYDADNGDDIKNDDDGSPSKNLDGGKTLNTLSWHPNHSDGLSSHSLRPIIMIQKHFADNCYFMKFVLK